MTKGRKIAATPKHPRYLNWRDFMDLAPADPVIDERWMPMVARSICHSGGTTGTPKTIMLSSYNFNVLAIQGPQLVGITNADQPDYDPVGMSMITILPLLSGFGLCMGLHTMLVNSLCAILIPQFFPQGFSQGDHQGKAIFHRSGSHPL